MGDATSGFGVVALYDHIIIEGYLDIENSRDDELDPTTLKKRKDVKKIYYLYPLLFIFLLKLLYLQLFLSNIQKVKRNLNT